MTAACCGEESVFMWSSNEWEEDGTDEAEAMARWVA